MVFIKLYDRSHYVCPSKLTITIVMIFKLVFNIRVISKTVATSLINEDYTYAGCQTDITILRYSSVMRVYKIISEYMCT